ncbi:hypothetical protein [Orenia marismortui]|uniref:hypothetical protein n=1 Tax=Orenia marismortui TaxID=46469 RepID=UPI000364A6B7|nr:hypothetical protein [Orenia marismortui]
MFKINLKRIIYLIAFLFLVIINFYLWTNIFTEEEISPRAKKVFSNQVDLGLRSVNYE